MAESEVILVMPYPFSDHPSFPEALLKRSLEQDGFKVGLLECPDWQNPDSFRKSAKPSLCFAVVPGPVDSLVLNYTSSGKRRNEDLYQFQGRAFFPGAPASIKSKIRPDRTLIVFANRLRQAWKEVPIIIGGIEASLRRFAHYDFHDRAVRRSILLDSRADLLVSGMGELPLLEICRGLRAGKSAGSIRFPGLTWISREAPLDRETVFIPSFEEVSRDSLTFLKAQERIEQACRAGRQVCQPHAGRYLVSAPAWKPTGDELDRIYGLAYQRRHPNGIGKTPALAMNLFSVTSHRGCRGACRFCALAAHQGSRVISRSPESILEEIRKLGKQPDWKGIVTDVGGPSADMYGKGCCPEQACLEGVACPIEAGLKPYIDLLSRARRVHGVKKVLVGSGMRYESFIGHPEALREILSAHCGAYLRVAPEHTENRVLELMNKGDWEQFREFATMFNRINETLARPVQLRPYLIVGHPGESRADVRQMKKKLAALGIHQADVQVFTPTPGTMASAMHLAGKNPAGTEIEVSADFREGVRRKEMLREFFSS